MTHSDEQRRRRVGVQVWAEAVHQDRLREIVLRGADQRRLLIDRLDRGKNDGRLVLDADPEGITPACISRSFRDSSSSKHGTAKLEVRPYLQVVHAASSTPPSAKKTEDRDTLKVLWSWRVMTAALEARGLVKHFGHIAALDGFDLDVAEGEICGLVGHNGAGKTDVCPIAAGLLDSRIGCCASNGRRGRRDPRRARRYLGVAPQELARTPPRRVGRTSCCSPASTGSTPSSRERIEGLAESMALAEVLDRRVRVLSGGQQRRLQAATPCSTSLRCSYSTSRPLALIRSLVSHCLQWFATRGMAALPSSVRPTIYLNSMCLTRTLAVADHGHLIVRVRRSGDVADALPGHAVLEFADGSLDVSRLPTIAGELHVQGAK